MKQSWNVLQLLESKMRYLKSSYSNGHQDDMPNFRGNDSQSVMEWYHMTVGMILSHYNKLSVTLVAIIGTFILVPYLKMKSLQLTWRSQIC